ncbi:MAG: hypothetical protein HY725_12935 [Candidatus Rokubacteria bacterium]|nr:hypothetical protein [Candidatus Rokubacteria bacterium]
MIFAQLRDFLRHDLKNVLGMEHGGNYTAALLVAVGAEALSLLQDQDPDQAFIGLLTPYGIDEHMAKDIIDALRHGLAHTFDTRFIQVGSKYVELIVSWGEQEHLGLRAEPPGLYLNVRTMWADLQKALAEVEAGLTADQRWASQVPRDWAKRWVHQARPQARPGWEQRFDP